MKNNIDSSIKSKLNAIFIGFEILVLLLTLIGFVGISNAQRIDSEVYEKQTVPMNTITNIVENILIASSSFDMAILAEDQEEVKEYKTRVEEINTETPKLIEAYIPTIATKEEEAAFNKAVDLYNSFLIPKSPEVFKLLEEGKPDEADEVMGSIDSKIDEMMDLFEQCRSITADTNDTFRAQNHMQYEIIKAIMILTSLLILILVIIVGRKIPKSITRPMVALEQMASHVENTGSLDLPEHIKNEVNIAGKRSDEIGKTVRAFLSMMDLFADRAKSLSLISDGNLTDKIHLKSNQDTMGISLQAMITSLNTLLTEINQSSIQVAIGAKQVAIGSQTLAQGNSEQMAIVDNFNGVIDTIVSQSQKNAEMSQEAATLEDKIRIDAQMGTEEMENMVKAVEDITESSRNINRVIKVIEDIAFQTNILALNAAVEAARAGDHGKGFAVVAEEVRALAVKSADAVKETSEMIESSIQKAQIGAKIAKDTEESLVRIVAGVNTSSEVISEIAKINSGQNTIVDEINSSISKISQSVVESAAAAEQSSASAEQMQGQAEALQMMVSRFKLM